MPTLFTSEVGRIVDILLNLSNDPTNAFATCTCCREKNLKGRMFHNVPYGYFCTEQEMSGWWLRTHGSSWEIAKND
jgi:hypothetical protein